VRMRALSERIRTQSPRRVCPVARLGRPATG
jgi:hypothetical protein